MKLTNEQLTEFFLMLSSHNWYYEMSDDFRTWSSGLAERRKINLIANEHEMLERMKNDFKRWKWGEGSRPKVENYSELGNAA